MASIAHNPDLGVGYMPNSMGIRNVGVFFLISLYLLFNYGFMLVRFPPGEVYAIPVGELMLAIYLLKINYNVFINRIAAIMPLMILVVWWSYGLGHAIYDGLNRGIWALRDATHVIESLFLIVGFCFAGRAPATNYLTKWLPFLLLSVVLYSLGYPAREYLQSLSPKIISAAGYEVPLLFEFTNTAMILIWSSVYILLFKKGRVYSILAAIMLAYAILLFQARTIYLQVLVVFFMFFLFRREVVGRLFFAVAIIFFALFVVSFSGVKIEGRLGQEVSIEFVVNHILAIGGVKTDGLEGAAYGVYQRLAWWETLFRSLSNGLVDMFFGLGYGIPLTDFYLANGAIVRELHNSYLSLLGRLGLFGVALWLLLHVALLSAWWSGYRISKKFGLVGLNSWFLFILSYFVMIWVFSIGEDAFEKPYNAIPYYFFWGVVLRWVYMLKFSKLVI